MSWGGSLDVGGCELLIFLSFCVCSAGGRGEFRLVFLAWHGRIAGSAAVIAVIHTVSQKRWHVSYV